ncbi:hypothetical protein C2S53_012316 [Perilla frutescens var. hirtella]|uniref:AAA+ ATPase domain-containing protein n=1 Tax=Perilla frutescens var. hirtella TaxID=608512 RepID=A0AAD4P1W9_PERFH|nr:hypothetical protein C2S53_012316 [Perilla frutescens var. hirtella]
MLAMMEAVLKDLAEMQAKGHTFTELERQIREAVYNAEDTIDASITHKHKSRDRSAVKQFMPGSKASSLATEVKELRKKLRPLYDEARQTLTGLPRQDLSSAGTRAAGASDDDNKLKKLPREDNVVGFAEEEATLIRYLKEETEELDVISIVGMPGLGKTTLAWKIYRDRNTEYEFPTKIWVYVSQEFNVKDVFLAILKKFTNENMSSRSVEDLAGKVRSRLQQGRFLLFLDDVWTVEDWEKIDAALPKTNKSGKVLITSRHERVAVRANPIRDPHKLRFLTFEESWELLQLEVFGRNNGCSPELVGPGMHIARKCDGVPLAVVVIGGILAEKRVDRKYLWEKVSVDVSAYIQNDAQKRTENIILLSYNKLPHDLRDCFLYLGTFAEDSEIPTWKLTRLWIAEGFIKQNQNHGIRSLEEAAEDNLNDLVARNLVMVEKTKANGDVKTCRVHDMIREFCKDQAGLDNRNLFQEVKKTREGVFHPRISEIGKCRRLSIHSHVVEFIKIKAKGPKVRSFLCFSKETVNLPPECIPGIPEAFDLLRVIDASPIKFTRFPSKLTGLIHLRYITLSGNDLKALPKDASRLWNLQTVRIDTTAREFEIRADIGKMKQLRHLKTKAAIILKEVQGEGGENLQTLSRLSTKSCTERVFSRAKNLKNLGIRGDLAAIVDKNFLEKLERLEKLKLMHDTLNMNVPGSALRRLPPADSFPPNLRILTLSSTHLDWPHMATLGGLRKLEVLKLKEMAFKGSRWEAEGSGFRCLGSLHIARTDLEIWTIASGDPFPKLKNLVLKNCERLQQIPSQLGRSLQFVELERVTKPLVESAERIKAANQEMQREMGGRRGGFKLIISPGDALATTSS